MSTNSALVEPAHVTASTPTPRKPRKSGKRWFLAIVPFVLPAIFIGAWEYAGQNKLIADGLFPSASASIEALVDFIFATSERSSIYSGDWLEAVGSSAERILTGFFLGSILAIVLGLLAGYSELTRRAVNPMIDVLRPISITAWIPIALIIFGIGNKPAIFLVALATFFPVYVNTLTGARSAEGRLLRAAAMLGANKRQMLLRVTLPATLPSIATGMRVGLALAWTSVVVAEILGARSGLGYVLIDAYNQFRFDYVVACMISLGALGLISDRILGLLFKRPLRWVEKAAEA